MTARLLSSVRPWLIIIDKALQTYGLLYMRATGRGAREDRGTIYDYTKTDQHDGTPL